MALLEVQDCSLSFGGLRAVSQFHFTLDSGQLVGLIGPNGAGKTTVFNLVTGVYAPESGSIRFDGQSIAGMPTYQINRRGIARTFQAIRLFPNMTVLDNVLIGFNQRVRHYLGTSILQSREFQAEQAEIEHEGHALLKMLGLDGHADSLARSLPYGDQRRLEIARALATKPKLLLLDEPAAGMNPHEKEQLMQRIRWFRDHLGLGVLVIEHDMKLIMQVCERITVLDHGETIALGKPDEIRKHPKVIEAYLGEATV